MDKIKIVIVDDMIDITDYFSMILNREKETQVVGVAHTGQEGVKLALKLKPDIVLMDIQMEHKYAGIDAIKEIKASDSEIKIIVLTVDETDEMLFKAFAAGASEYVNKTASIIDILQAIKSVHSNQLSLRPEVSQKLLKEFSRVKTYEESLLYVINIISKLTTAEFEVLKALNSGKSPKQVAEERFVEPVTIRAQISKILKKFDEKNIKAVLKLLNEFHLFDVL